MQRKCGGGVAPGGGVNGFGRSLYLCMYVCTVVLVELKRWKLSYVHRNDHFIPI